MAESKSGSSGISSSTDLQVVNLAATAVVVDYVPEALVRRAGAVQLLIPTTRKRCRPIVVHVSDDLLKQLLEVRGDWPSEEIADLEERNKRQSDVIITQANRLRGTEEKANAQAEELRALRGQLVDVESRFTGLSDAYVARGKDLHALRQNFDSECDAAKSLKKRCEQLGEAIRKVLNPTDTRAAWQTAHAAIRHALAREGFHPQISHGFFSWARWFGCSNCVPEWQMYPATELSNGQAAPARAVVAALKDEATTILQPALQGDTSVPKLVHSSED